MSRFVTITIVVDYHVLILRWQRQLLPQIDWRNASHILKTWIKIIFLWYKFRLLFLIKRWCNGHIWASLWLGLHIFYLLWESELLGFSEYLLPRLRNRSFWSNVWLNVSFGIWNYVISYRLDLKILSLVCYLWVEKVQRILLGASVRTFVIGCVSLSLRVLSVSDAVPCYCNILPIDIVISLVSLLEQWVFLSGHLLPAHNGAKGALSL